MAAAIAALLVAVVVLSVLLNAAQNSQNRGGAFELSLENVYAAAQEEGYSGTLQEFIDAFKGDNAYAVAVSNGYTGTEQQWLATLIGATGATGSAGVTPHIGENGHWYIGDGDSGVPARGERGADGAAWYVGTGEPISLFGDINDFFLDTDTWNLYRKASLGWESVGNIKGADGQGGTGDGSNGIDGATWLFGTGAPESSLGQNGDFYLDTAAWSVYVKAAGDWESVGSIKGETGGNGSNGADGDNGATGKSIYQLWCEAHPDYPYDEARFLSDYVTGQLTNWLYTYVLSGDENYYIVTAFPAGIASATIPAEWKGKPVKQVGATGAAVNVFGGHTNATLIYLVLPEGIVTLGAFAFEGCTALRTAVIPSTLNKSGMPADFNARPFAGVTFSKNACRIFYNGSSGDFTAAFAENLSYVGFGARSIFDIYSDVADRPLLTYSTASASAEPTWSWTTYPYGMIPTEHAIATSGGGGGEGELEQ
jgi:hypothetical protein